MLTRRGMFTIVIIAAALALMRAFLPVAQRPGIVWLLAVSALGPWIVWHFAKQLFTAAMHGYILTGVPEARVYRADNPNLYRNNVIAHIILFPMVAAGFLILLLDALQAVHLIR